MKRASNSFTSFASAALAVLASGGLFLAALSSAEAAPTLRLTTSQGGGVTVVDSGSTGFVSFNGPLAGFNINFTAGVTKPNLGNVGRPILDLNSLNVSTGPGAGGTLTIEFTDTDFASTQDQLKWLASIGGVTTGTVSYQLYAAESNVAFEQGVLLADTGTIGAGAFAEELQALTDFGAGNTFSTTLVVTINHSGENYQATSFNAAARVPEPGTLALFGIGLAGLGLMRRRRQKVAA